VRIHAGDTRSVPRVDLRAPADIAVAMLRKALDAFARLDVNSSAEVVRQDREVDAGFKAAMRQLITFMMEDPRTISSSLDLLFVARSIERVGDHAKNISEYVVYLVKGRDVRHIGLEVGDGEGSRGRKAWRPRPAKPKGPALRRLTVCLPAARSR
jgi:phosphate transport system protein